MGYNRYIGRTEAELVEALRQAQDEDLRGSQIVGTGSGDVNASFTPRESPGSRIPKILMALHQLNPDDYPLSMIVPTRKTFAVMGRQI